MGWPRVRGEALRGIGLDGGEWTISVCRVKSRRKHRVPPSPWTLEKTTGDRSSMLAGGVPESQ